MATIKNTIFPLLLLASISAGATPVNYALNQTATASGSFSGGGAYSVASGNDGSTSTGGWNGGAFNAWWMVNLGAAHAIDQLEITAWDDPGRHQKFQLSSSMNGVDWTQVGATTTMGGSASGGIWSVVFQTNGASMQYIKYTVIGESGSDWANLAELRAIGDSPSNSAPEAATLILALTSAGMAGLWRRRSSKI